MIITRVDTVFEKSSLRIPHVGEIKVGDTVVTLKHGDHSDWTVESVSKSGKTITLTCGITFRFRGGRWTCRDYYWLLIPGMGEQERIQNLSN